MTAARRDPLDLVASARDLLKAGAPGMEAIWPRAAAVLARQSIEMALDSLWQLRVPGMQYTSARCQLLCLPTYLGDVELAERTSAAHGALSRALHHHPYELAPTHQELLGWITTAWDLGNHVARVERTAAGRP